MATNGAFETDFPTPPETVRYIPRHASLLMTSTEEYIFDPFASGNYSGLPKLTCALHA